MGEIPCRYPTKKNTVQPISSAAGGSALLFIRQDILSRFLQTFNPPYAVIWLQHISGPPGTFLRFFWSNRIPY